MQKFKLYTHGGNGYAKIYTGDDPFIIANFIPTSVIDPEDWVDINWSAEQGVVSVSIQNTSTLYPFNCDTVINIEDSEGMDYNLHETDSLSTSSTLNYSLSTSAGYGISSYEIVITITGVNCSTYVFRV